MKDVNESRNNHRYAVAVQDLATQWIQSYHVKQKTSQEMQKSLQKILEPTRNQKSFTLTIPWNLASLAKNYPGIFVRRLHRSETDGIAERAVRRIKEGTPAVLL